MGLVDAAGRMYSLARAARSWVTAGATPWMRAASQACGVMVISAEPQRVALKILFAAWVVLAATPGVVAPSENHLNSFSACPVNCA